MNNSSCNLNWFTTVNSAFKPSDLLAEDSLATLDAHDPFHHREQF